MDGARSAKRLVGTEGEVSIVYRRTRAEMPADPEEVRDCDAEGIEHHVSERTLALFAAFQRLSSTT